MTNCLKKKLNVGEANARLFEKGYDFLGQYPETSHYIKMKIKTGSRVTRFFRL